MLSRLHESILMIPPRVRCSVLYDTLKVKTFTPCLTQQRRCYCISIRTLYSLVFHSSCTLLLHLFTPLFLYFCISFSFLPTQCVLEQVIQRLDEISVVLTGSRSWMTEENTDVSPNTPIFVWLFEGELSVVCVCSSFTSLLKWFSWVSFCFDLFF